MSTTTNHDRPETGQKEGFTSILKQMPAKSANKTLLFILIVDVTPSMEKDGKIGAVGVAIQEIVSLLKQFSGEKQLNIRFILVSFTNSVRWEMEVSDINQCLDVPAMTVRPGSTQFSEVYHALCKRLTKEDLLNFPGKKVPPMIVFLTDGEPSDRNTNDLYLEELKNNGWFAQSKRSAVLMGDAVNSPKAREAVAEFVSDEKSILSADSTSQIIKQISLATLQSLLGGDDDHAELEFEIEQEETKEQGEEQETEENSAEE